MECFVTIDEIYDEWVIDSKIDSSDLGTESLKIPQLHHKYYKMLTKERLLLKSKKYKHKQLFLEKYQFYTEGPTKEQHEKGWVLPAKGIILKNEVEKFLDADKELINSNLSVHVQEEKVEVLIDIIKTLNRRGFEIKNAIEDLKFKNGQ